MQKWCQNPKSKKVGRNFWRMRLIGNSVHISLAEAGVVRAAPECLTTSTPSPPSAVPATGTPQTSAAPSAPTGR